MDNATNVGGGAVVAADCAVLERAVARIADSAAPQRHVCRPSLPRSLSLPNPVCILLKSVVFESLLLFLRFVLLSSALIGYEQIRQKRNKNKNMRRWNVDSMFDRVIS